MKQPADIQTFEEWWEEANLKMHLGHMADKAEESAAIVSDYGIDDDSAMPALARALSECHMSAYDAVTALGELLLWHREANGKAVNWATADTEPLGLPESKRNDWQSLGANPIKVFERLGATGRYVAKDLKRAIADMQDVSSVAALKTAEGLIAKARECYSITNEIYTNMGDRLPNTEGLS